MTKNVIEIRNVTKRYGEILAVDGVSLSVGKGEILGLIGHNGAGKSTLFKMMLGLLPPTAGEIVIDGQSVHGSRFRDVRRRIGYLPENVVFYDNLTGLETLWFFADLKGVKRGACMPALERVGLAQAAGRRVRGYSKGMRQRLGFAQALLGSPAILFLDEPTTGLDPEGIREFYGILAEMKNQGATVVLTSHILAEIQERVDRLAIMKSGHIQALGTVQALREQVNLPLRFEITPRPGVIDALQRKLAAACDLDVHSDGSGLLVTCHRDQKLAMLAILPELMPNIADVQMREPSLEDVFLGYGATAVAAQKQQGKREGSDGKH